MAKAARKSQPVQARAQATRDALLRATADLLGEIGIERLSTNLICARAGVTPPAFYRYFKDKYAVLEELGEQLMEAQNAAMLPLIARDNLDVSEADIKALILDSIAITQAFPGGPWLLRALRAAPALAHIRAGSHRRMSALIAKAVAKQNAKISADAAIQARLLIDMGYAAIELAFDEKRMKREAIARNAAASLFSLVKALRTA